MPSNHRFLSSSNIAVFGISPSRDTFAKTISEALEKAGFNVYKVHPSGEANTFKNLDSIPEKIESVYIATNQKNTLGIIDNAISYGAKRVWLQFGSYNNDIVKKCKDAGVETFTGCPMMYIPGTGLMHKFHRFFHELFTGKP